jgi:ABC-type antimicrobial peptide transport system permease subunit
LVGLGVGLFFIAPAVLVHEAFLGYPPLVLAIDASKEIVGGIIVGGIVAAWPRRNAA